MPCAAGAVTHSRLPQGTGTTTVLHDGPGIGPVAFWGSSSSNSGRGYCSITASPPSTEAAYLPHAAVDRVQVLYVEGLKGRSRLEAARNHLHPCVIAHEHLRRRRSHG